MEERFRPRFEVSVMVESDAAADAISISRASAKITSIPAGLGSESIGLFWAERSASPTELRLDFDAVEDAQGTLAFGIEVAPISGVNRESSPSAPRASPQCAFLPKFLAKSSALSLSWVKVFNAAASSDEMAGTSPSRCRLRGLGFGRLLFLVCVLAATLFSG
ncbi:hypothetical protein NliqN6_1683 [Naganishia liquefaciens]|uniref:Uncharacterized protein n=1 Tax=Naganishia liquefaciens TaxID=104408 RepID=A0A8H3TQU9_9TREE|nr:hypothetical protein NliqN6_1683 [Naganishia liquefaciens]